MSSSDDARLKELMIFFILGGPGAGKGTLCSRLTREIPSFIHLSAGDLLRAEQETGGEHAELIRGHIINGTIVPKEITIDLLRKAMLASDARVVLIDGFPRAIDQADCFEETVKPGEACIYLTCSEEVMTQRICGRDQGRDDDNMESLLKRFRVFKDTTLPVIDRFESTGRLLRANGEQHPQQVFAEVYALFKSKLSFL